MTNRLMSEIVSRQKPVSMLPSATVQEACRVMRDRRIGAVVVADDGSRVVGIFTGRDAVCRMLAEARDPSRTTLAEVMTARPDTMAPGRHAIDALRLMQDGGFRHLPVVHNGSLVGIVSSGDFRGLEQAQLDEETGYWEIL
jgi:CBS domain-containing protein